MKRSAFVSVPASSGNLGPGFDVLGLALSLRNELHVHVRGPKGPSRVDIRGEGERTLPRDGRNLILNIMGKVFAKAGVRMPALDVRCVNRIPLARGLGSSSAAILSSLLAANRLLSDRFSRQEILNWASALEGHPDNVAPALLGGVQAAGVFGGQVVASALPAPSSKMIVAIPAFELSTEKARRALPKKIPLKDAVFNFSAIALLPLALRTAPELLGSLLNDRSHEPYRARLIPGFHSVKSSALRSGAHGVILSGAGPTMLAFAPASRVKKIADAMTKAFERAGVVSRALTLSIDKKGSIIR